MQQVPVSDLKRRLTEIRRKTVTALDNLEHSHLRPVFINQQGNPLL
jgi:hypothetical protein